MSLLFIGYLSVYMLNTSRKLLSNSFFVIIAQVRTNSLKSTDPSAFVSNTVNIKLYNHMKMKIFDCVNILNRFFALHVRISKFHKIIDKFFFFHSTRRKFFDEILGNNSSIDLLFIYSYAYFVERSNILKYK